MSKQLNTTPLRLLRLPELLHKVGYSRASVYKQIQSGDFPKPIKLGPRAVAWSEEIIDSWIKSRLSPDFAVVASEPKVGVPTHKKR